MAATFAEAGLPELTLPDADFAGLARLDFAGLFFAVLKTDLDLGVTATMDATHLPDQKQGLEWGKFSIIANPDNRSAARLRISFDTA